MIRLAAGLLVLAAACGPGGGSTPAARPDTVADGPRDTAARPPGSATLHLSPGALRLGSGASADAPTIGALEGASGASFVDAALRPGSTVADATVVALTTGEEGYRLRWLTVDAGIAGPLTPFPDRYPVAPSPPEPADGEGPSVSWTPDGASVVWLEWGEGGETTLRTVGWADGPGTGDPATDNAAFSLGPVPAGSRIAGWLEDDTGTAWTMAMASPGGDRWLLRMERQGDGAVALPGGANPCRAPCEP